MARLTGEALLEHVKANAGADRDEIIESAGYVATRNGKRSLQRTEFFQALSQAQGLEIGPTVPRNNKGKEPGFQLKVGPKGMIPVGPAYTSKIGVKPGGYVNVEIDGDCIVLAPAT